RFADELVSIARDRGHVVAWGRVWEAVGAPPYWPWVQVLRPLIRGGTDDSLRELLGPGARDVAQILPELRERIAEIPSSIEADSDSARFQLFDSTATFLRNVGERRPLLCVLDDMHAADLPSIRLLRFVAGQVAGAHLLLMATYRDLELVHRSAIAVELEEITREPTTRALRLTGLAVDDVRTLLLGESEDARGSAATGAATTLWRKTGGNPLFIAESVRLLSPDGRLGRIDDSTVRVAVPPGVREAISRRLADVDPATVELLRVGALLGPEFDLDLVRRLVGSGTEKAQDLADDAVGDGLIQIVPGALRRYRFAH